MGNKCFDCIDKDCVNCIESIPGSEYQRAWEILRKKIQYAFQSNTVRIIKKLMHESFAEAKNERKNLTGEQNVI